MFILFRLTRYGTRHRRALAGVFRSVQKHRDDLTDCEFNHTYLCELKVPLASLQKQESEVEALNLISLDLFLRELEVIEHGKKYVPHDIDYYKTIIAAVHKNL